MICVLWLWCVGKVVEEGVVGVGEVMGWWNDVDEVKS